MKTLTFNITMEKLAKLAGVSIATVSRVFSNSNKVTDATKKKILDLAEKYEFHPNETARTMAAGKSKLISVVLPDVVNPYFSKLLEHLSKLCIENDYTMVFYNSNGDTNVEQKIVHKMISRQVDGLLITMTQIESPTIPLLKKAPFPVVVMCRNIEGLDSVGINHREGGELAAEYFFKQQKKQFCYFGQATDEKFIGFRNYLLSKGVQDEKIKVIGNQDWYVKTLEKGQEILSDYISKSINEKIGLFCTNDYYAAGALSIAQNNKISVPDEMSIVGFDDTMLGEITNPQLTTIHQPLNRIAKSCFSILLQRIGEKESASEKHNVSFSPKIVIRGT